MSISRFITRREPSEIRDLGINLNDFAPAENVSPFRQAIRNAVTRVQPKGIMDNAFNTLYGQDTISNLEAQYGLGGSGIPSQARHQAALNELSKNLNIGDFGPGNLFTALAASATEIPDVIRTGDVKESARDIFDNLKGALATDKTKTPAEVYRDIYEGGSNTSGIVRAFKNIPEFFGNLIFTPLGADSEKPAPIEDDLMEYDEFYDMPEEKKKGILQTILSKGKDIVGNISDKIPNFGIMGLLSKLDNFKNLSPLDRQFILEQAGGNRPAKDRYGYNIRSAFGNYADLVSRRAQIARNRALFKQPLRAIDLYYQKKEAERAAKDRAILDAEFAAGRGGSGQDFTGGRYDGAPDAATYSAEPTAYSGSS